MANDLNQCQFIGRLGKAPEVSYLPSGRAVCKISIAVSKSWKAKDTGQKQERTTWVPIVAFDKLAEIMGEYLKKGAQVFISGEFLVRKWQDQSGADRYTTEIVASDMQMLDSRPSGGSAHASGYDDYQYQQQAARQPGNQPHTTGGPQSDFDDDIPFAQFERGTIA